MLDVVVQGPVDVRDLARRQGDGSDPVVVKRPADLLRKRQHVVEQAASEHRRRAADRVGDDERSEVIVSVRPRRPVCVGQEAPALIHDPHVAVYERRPLVAMGEQRLELVRVPPVILVAQGYELHTRRHQGEASLEVVVEAERGPRAGHANPRILERDPPDRVEDVGRRAVVADDADPVRIRLASNREDLSPEQLERRVERGHADRDQRSAGDVWRRRSSRTDIRDAPRLERHRRNLLRAHAAVAEFGPKTQIDENRLPALRERHDRPECAPESVALWIRGWIIRGGDGWAGHRPGLYGVDFTVGDDMQLHYPVLRMITPPGEVEGVPPSDHQNTGYYRVHLHHEIICSLGAVV